MVDVLCIGILVGDIVTSFQDVPTGGALRLLKKVDFQIGGCAANTGIALARLGLATEVIGAVGDDWLGRMILDALTRESIVTDSIARVGHERTSMTIVNVAGDGERSFLHYRGANRRLTVGNISKSRLVEARLVHIGGTFLLPGLDGDGITEILRRAKTMGKVTSLDTAWDTSGRWLELIDSSLPYIDILVPSIEEAREISGEREPQSITQFFQSRGVQIVALKMGKDGCYVRQGADEIRLAGPNVDVKDTTGAGDAFAGGFLAGYLNGYDLRRCAQLATTVAACCITSVGATAGLPRYEEAVALAARLYPGFTNQGKNDDPIAWN